VTPNFIWVRMPHVLQPMKVSIEHYKKLRHRGWNELEVLSEEESKKEEAKLKKSEASKRKQKAISKEETERKDATRKEFIKKGIIRIIN